MSDVFDSDVEGLIKNLQTARTRFREARDREEQQRLAEPKDSIRQLQRDLATWQRRNFPTAKRLEPVVGIAEEVGEAWEVVLQLAAFGQLTATVGRVCHAALKHDQGIRGTKEELQAKLQDAIGDLFIFMVNICNLFEIDLQQVVNETWAVVSKRNWQADPIGGSDG